MLRRFDLLTLLGSFVRRSDAGRCAAPMLRRSYALEFRRLCCAVAQVFVFRSCALLRWRSVAPTLYRSAFYEFYRSSAPVLRRPSARMFCRSAAVVLTLYRSGALPLGRPVVLMLVRPDAL